MINKLEATRQYAVNIVYEHGPGIKPVRGLGPWFIGSTTESTQ